MFDTDLMYETRERVLDLRVAFALRRDMQETDPRPGETDIEFVSLQWAELSEVAA